MRTLTHTYMDAYIGLHTCTYRHICIHTYICLYRGCVLVRGGFVGEVLWGVFCRGPFCPEGFLRGGFCSRPLLSEYNHYNRKLNTAFNFSFHMYAKQLSHLLFRSEERR